MAVLKLGCKGPDVGALQDRLRALGFDPGPTNACFETATHQAVIAFQSLCLLKPDGIVGKLTAAALAGATPPPPLPAAFGGFDTSIYPGDAGMAVWKQSSPYTFVAYYLRAPCHRNASWMGRRAALIEMGWNLLPVYVGQQVAGVSPCSSAVLTANRGRTDALDAAAKMAAEGFPHGSYVYLDIERSDAFPDGLAQYIAAWVTTIVARGRGAGIYCHKHNASDIRSVVLGAIGSGPQPHFWIVGGSASQFDVATSRPPDCGIAFADLWQCPVSVDRTFGGVTVNIDENVSRLPDPAGA